MKRNAAERVRARVLEWTTRIGHGSKTRLARAIDAQYGEPKSVAWVTGVLRGPERKGQDVRLADLDALADALGVPPGDLVRRDGDHYLEVTPSEMRLIRYFRRLPVKLQHDAMGVFDFLFAAHERELEAQDAERDRRTKAARRERELT